MRNEGSAKAEGKTRVESNVQRHGSWLVREENPAGAFGGARYLLRFWFLVLDSGPPPLDGARLKWKQMKLDVMRSCVNSPQVSVRKEQTIKDCENRTTVNSPQVSVRKEPKPDTCRVRDYVFEPRARLCSLPNVGKDSE
ncbi:hypothetical protein WH47_01959 [Habropoda laboriosa]|uniref:Uncharacterized protein n=1 Tax=Habropoda laboriosa TaxID=597456 RepID=A0A0L7QY42_9HYME|nr:hypothetical protein WH47_01959 [Habropoda laboriosa]